MFCSIMQWFVTGLAVFVLLDCTVIWNDEISVSFAYYSTKTILKWNHIVRRESHVKEL